MLAAGRLLSADTVSLNESTCRIDPVVFGSHGTLPGEPYHPRLRGHGDHSGPAASKTICSLCEVSSRQCQVHSFFLPRFFILAEELRATVKKKSHTSSRRASAARGTRAPPRTACPHPAPRLTITRLHQRFREGNGTRCPEHPRPPAFPSKRSGMSQRC